MLKATFHRGKEGIFIQTLEQENYRLYLGHNRLKIQDLSDEANQPFFSECGRYVLVFNGEIYNHTVLRQALSKKYVFRTQSDTEVLLYWLAEQHSGDSALKLPPLKGMYAYVWLDLQEQKLYAGRDRRRIKPLYVFENENYLILASEIKAILASGFIDKRLNQNQIPYYLLYRYPRFPFTFFEGIEELTGTQSYDLIQPTSWVILPETQEQYNGFSPKDSILTQVENLLLDAVTQQLKADVPVGLFLSGGVDSTLLLALASETGHHTLPVFSISCKMEEKSFGTADLHYAKLAARMYQAEHCLLEIDEQILNVFPEVVAHLDQPIADPALLLTYILSGETRKQVKSVLSGAGADEWFAGYNRHSAYQSFLRHYKTINFFLPLLRWASSLLPDGFSHPYRKKIRLWKKFTEQLSPNAWQTFLLFTQLQSKELLHNTEWIKEQGKFQGKSLLDLALFTDRHNYLPSDVLKMTDEMAMAQNLEVRLPYLDEDLTNYLNDLPASVLLQKGRKWILKELLNKRGGELFTRRPKEGFGFPFGAWINRPQWRFLLDPLQNPHHPVYQTVIYEKTQRMLALHLSQKRDYSSEIWALALLFHWIDHHFNI